MLEGLFFHWVHMDDARIAIRDAKEPAFHVYLGPASSPTTRQDNTFMGARTTLDRAIAQFFVKVRLLDMRICRRKTLFGPGTAPWNKQSAAGGTQAVPYEVSAG
jgi:hypothetical protein